MVEEKSMEDRNMEDDVEADENDSTDAVLSALRRVIERGIVIWGDQKKKGSGPFCDLLYFLNRSP